MSFENKKLYPNWFDWVRFSVKSTNKFAWVLSIRSYFQDKNRKNILIWVWVFFVLIFAIWFTKNVIQGMPDITQIKNMVFSESTTIEDRNGKVLYKLYKENREYIPFSGISQNMVNAIIAMEDQRYWEHNGLDPMGILRAWINNIIHPGRWMQWASTIQQQLLKNILLNVSQKKESTQEKIVRKIREVLLTSRLNWTLEDQIHQEQGKLDSDQLRKEMKNKVLELYLNYIPFWNNAFGVEAASKTYFDKSAKDIDVLESSILASIPKSASIYNPYKNRAKVMWEFVVKDVNGSSVPFTGEIVQSVLAQLSKTFWSIEIANKDNSFYNSLSKLWSFSISATNSGSISNLVVSYIPWRKDSALTRMYEDWYITQNQVKQAFLQSINYQFRKNKVDMIAPHFVQWIIEELEKTYDKDTLFKWWIVVKTSLDLDIQTLAEESLNANASVLQENGANNSSMIYLDSKNWDVLAYVGSINYFDEKIEWQNDMVRSNRQSGSSIKPFIYALGFEKLPLTLDTPIFDIPFKIWKDTPSNADDKFSGLIPLKYALAWSRNIPATKMITALWWEELAKPFLQKLGLSWVKSNVEYWYTLALWAAEITMMQLANAYMHLSNTKPAFIDPILEIRSRDGSLIYQREVKQQEEVIKPWVSYLMWKILSEPTNRLPWWISKFNVAWLSLAIKSWTSNAKTDKGNRPRDWWMATYNASKVALFRAWNADGTPMNRNAFGGTIHATPMKNFFAKLLKNNYITNDTIKSVDVSNAQISKISGKLANDKTPSEYIVDTMYYIRGVWLSQDDWAEVIDYDTSCKWAQSQATPLNELKKWYVISPSSFMPGNMDMKEITQRWTVSSIFTWDMPEWWYVSGNVVYNYWNVFITKPTEICEGREIKEDTSIQIDLIKPDDNKVSQKFSLWYNVKASRKISSVLLFADDKQIAQFTPKIKNTTISELRNISSDLSDWNHDMQLVVVDEEWYSNKENFLVDIVSTDTQSPTVLENKTQVVKTDSGKYEISIIFDDDLSYIWKWKIILDTKTVKEFDGDVASFTLDNLALVNVYVQDAYGNKLEKTINLTIQ